MSSERIRCRSNSDVPIPLATAPTKAAHESTHTIIKTCCESQTAKEWEFVGHAHMTMLEWLKASAYPVSTATEMPPSTAAPTTKALRPTRRTYPV